jgi:DNA-binding XRE family transcriptional regulator
MNLASVFSEARLQFDAQRREQVELARQALELKMMQHDLAKTIGEIKAALAQLESTKAAPMPLKAATAAPEAKVVPPAPKAAPKAAPQSIAIDGLEQRLAAVSAKIAALAARTK